MSYKFNRGGIICGNYGILSQANYCPDPQHDIAGYLVKLGFEPGKNKTYFISKQYYVDLINYSLYPIKNNTGQIPNYIILYMLHLYLNSNKDIIRQIQNDSNHYLSFDKLNINSHHINIEDYLHVVPIYNSQGNIQEYDIYCISLITSLFIYYLILLNFLGIFI